MTTFDDAHLLLGVLSIDQADLMEEMIVERPLNAALDVLGEKRMGDGFELIAATCEAELNLRGVPLLDLGMASPDATDPHGRSWFIQPRCRQVVDAVCVVRFPDGRAHGRRRRRPDEAAQPGARRGHSVDSSPLTVRSTVPHEPLTEQAFCQGFVRGFRKAGRAQP
jgi:hypothetical protein